MRGFARFLLWTVLIVAALIGALRATAIRWIRLPTDDPVFEASVQPTLAGGDLIVTFRLGNPTFADLVLCPEPDYPDRYIIGRILGMPNETVHFRNGDLEIQGRRFRSERNCDRVTYPHPDNPALEVSQNCDMVDSGGHLHPVGGLAGHTVAPSDREYIVPETGYFLVSDNRLFPYDSREYGSVPYESCKERVIFRLVGRKGWKDSSRRFDYIQ